ncbi:Ig-like domain-containing protein [Marinomonas sp. RSW2]|uniref:Ig-like domain-containing protein n=1 Tax=Marinomonas maritima TaxID=2940935 RepID=A0ABT5WDM5_9GAMM|nr:Ig-like domain-containing protein [Marinomonas maritima]MDE8602919.1 Ig-like domain-containing protein [Marinomonas maritima]
MTSDSVINSDESSSGNLVAITGYVGNDAMPGDTISITLDGVVIGQGTVSEDQNSNGKYLYSVNVLGSDLANTTLVNPSIVVTVSGEDAAGNAFTAQSTEIYKVDIFADVDVFVSEASGDNVINLDEVGNLTVGGWVESEGTVTSITITDSNGNSITITDGISTEDDGSGWDYFEKNVDVSTLADGQLSVVVNTVDASGNTGSSEPQLIEKDTVADSGTVTIDPITSDDTIDGIELGQTISISGKAVGGDISVGDIVKMTINNTEYSTTVKAGGIWMIAGVLGSDLAADSAFDVVVTSSDAAGNKVESIGTSTHSVDLSAEANFSLAEGQQHVLTNLPEGFEFPDGTTEVTTNFGGTITLGGDGEYRYDAPVRDHGDTISDKDSATITLEDGRTFIVNLDIQDSAPVAVDDQDSIVVRHETFEVSGVEANWISYTNGSAIKVFDGTSSNGGIDNDDGKDQIRWGTSSGHQSGYGFIDNDAELSGKLDLNEDIIVGTFTHYNYPVSSGSAITAASMEVAFGVTDDTGVSEPVTLTVNFDHNETPNTSNAEASRDIVTVQNTFVTFEWESGIYTLQVVGFREVGNPDGEVVTSIYTNENAATSYELVVRVVEGEGYSLPETTGNVFDDNGLGADQLELSEDGGVTVVGVSAGETVSLGYADVGQSIKGQFGNLVLETDGSYVYEVTTGVSNIPTGATETFSYMIQDSDGSTSTATLTISVGTNTNTNTNTAPSAQDDSSSDSLVTLSEQTLEISVDSLLENDTDADGDALTVTSISNVQNGYAYLDSIGVIHFTPLQGFTGVATFDYTISDGRGGKDTATASVTVTADGILPTVTVSTAENTPDYDVNAWKGQDSNFESGVLANHGNSQGGNDTYYLNGDLNYSASSGDGSDEIVITGNVNRTLTLDSGDFSGDGDDNLLVKGELNSNGSIYSGAGNDSVEIRGNTNADVDLSDGDDRLAIGGSVNSNSEIDLGDGNDSAYVAHDLSGEIDAGNGNDTVEIGRNINSSGDVKLGKGDDVLLVQGDISGEIKGENGNDTVIIHGNVWSDAKIDLGKGNDVITIGGKLYSDVDGGKGSDSIYLASYTKNDYNNNVDNIKSRVISFENIMMSDGIVKGDSSGFNNGSSAFSYSVSVDIDSTSSTTETSMLTLFGIPSTATLTLDGETLTANSDGNYDIEITNGQTTIENLNVLSDSALPDLVVTSTVSYAPSVVDTTKDEDNYLVGTQDEDTLVGGLGDDILFGGDDETSDTLTGGEGKDIFILNDTTDVLNIDTITDFNAAEDALDLTDLLTGIAGSPDKDADADLIAEFLSQHVKVTDGNVKVDGEDVATFIEETSSFDSNNDGLVNSSDSIKVIYNNEEYSINIDG